MSLHQLASFLNDHENNNRWRLQQMLKVVEPATGKELLSLLVPRHVPIPDVINSLDEGTSQTESNRLQLQAISCAKQKLKEMRERPKNGVVVYSGTVIDEEGIEKEVSMCLEPFIPIQVSLCKFDNVFHTKDVSELLEKHEKYGFIVLDKNGAFFGLLGSYTYKVLEQFKMSVVSKVYQAASRWTNQKMSVVSTNQSFISKVSQAASRCYIDSLTNQVNIAGLVVAGTESLTTALTKFESFSSEFRGIRMHVVETSYGGDIGFNKAIEESKSFLPPGMRIMRERRVLQTFFGQLNEKTETCVWGVDKTLSVLLELVVTTLIVWEGLDVFVRVLRNKETGKRLIKELKEEEIDDEEEEIDEWDVEIKRILLVEWLVTKSVGYCFQLEIVSNKSKEGAQFYKAGFEGIAGMLRVSQKEEIDEEEEIDEDGEIDDDGY